MWKMATAGLWLIGYVGRLVDTLAARRARSWLGVAAVGCSVGDRMPATLDGFHGVIVDFAASPHLAGSTR